MKNFFYSLILFVLGLLVINTFLYFIVNKILYKPYSIDITKAQQFDSFLMADSHGKSINQEDLQKLSIYNLSFNSDSYIDIYIKLNYLIQNKIKIKKIYLTADEHTLSPYRENGNNNSRSVFFADFKTYNELYDKNIFNYFYETWILKYIAIINTNNSKLVRKYIFSENQMQEDEVVNFEELSNQQRKERADKRIDLQFVGKKPSVKMIKYLNKIFKLCKENNIRVYGIKFPLTKDYLNSLSTKLYNIESLFKQNNWPILDFKSIFIKNDNLFKNQDHLNDDGSNQFSKYLKNKIN